MINDHIPSRFSNLKNTYHKSRTYQESASACDKGSPPSGMMGPNQAPCLPTNLAKRKNQTGRSFAVVGPQLLNTLPAVFSDINTQELFRNTVSRYFRTLPDEPPVTGYARSHGNTLLEVEVHGGIQEV